MDSDNWRVKRDPMDTPRETRTLMRSYKQLHHNSAAGSSPFGQSSSNKSSPFQHQSRDGLRKPSSDGKVDKAIDEGRRVYVGNLPYEECYFVKRAE
jgi:hypothetical protein